MKPVTSWKGMANLSISIAAVIAQYYISFVVSVPGRNCVTDAIYAH